jgi:hypothetical protein
MIWACLVILFLIPWGIRNYKVYNQVVILSPRTTAFTSKIWGKDISQMNFQNKNREKSISSNERILDYQDGLSIEKEISSSEKKGIGLYLKTFINVWKPTYFKTKYVQYSWWPDARPQKWSTKHNLVSITFYGLFLPFYLIGLVLIIIKLDIIRLFLGIIPIIHSLLHTLMITPEERYRYPIVFIIVMIGFWAAMKLYEITKKYLNKDFESNFRTTSLKRNG